MSGGTVVGQITDQPQPVYPPDAGAQAVSGDPTLREAAVVAAKKARFRPAKLSGQTVKVTGLIQYNFVLQ